MIANLLDRQCYFIPVWSLARQITVTACSQPQMQRQRVTSQVNSIHRSAQWLLWPSLPAQWHSDCGYDSEIPTKHTISIYCKKECSTLSFGMEAFKMREEREEDYRGGKLTKQRGYSGAQGCGGGGGEERSGSHRILLFPTRELKNCNRKRFYSE